MLLSWKRFWSVVLGGLLGTCPLVNAQSVDFEPEEGFSGRAVQEEHPYWTLPGTASVQKGQGYQGEHYLVIEPGEMPLKVRYTPEKVPTEGVRFLALAIRPVVEEGHESLLRLGGVEFGFAQNHAGEISVLLLEGGDEIATQARAGATQGEADRWIHLMIRQDLCQGKWDLWVDGKLVLVEEKQPEKLGQAPIMLDGGTKGTVWLDTVVIGSVNPLFADRDGDGMPDAYEVAHGLNPYADDRNGDQDGDGVSNLLEFARGTPPDSSGQQLRRVVIYVDNQSGSDLNSGANPHGIGQSGPKASIKAAMASAEDGALIVVMPGKGTYEEGSRSAKGKRVTIRTVAPIKIK